MTPQTSLTTPKMEYLAVPLKVSRVALGTWAIGGWMWGGTDEDESIPTIRAALEHGDQPHRYGAGVRLRPLRRDRRRGARRRRPAHAGRIATKVGLDGRTANCTATPAGPDRAGGRGLPAPAADRRHRHLPGPLAGPRRGHRGDRGSDGGALSAGQDPRDRGQQLSSAQMERFAPCAVAYRAAAIQPVRARRRE